ncbi:glycosyltransferase family 4 protein [Candidatus Sumerlaeota bacterium]|nr:glycosyltransferase family 4 protein [Candidatus Sumerlaeota bacterium]
MKILYLCADSGVPIFGRKGCSTHVRENCLVLQEMGHEVRLICTNADGDDTDRAKLKPILVPPTRSRRLGFDLRHIINDRRVERAARELYKDWQPDAIYERYTLYSLAGTNLARRWGIPHLLEANAFMTVEQKNRIRLMPFARWTERRIFKRSRHVVVVSDPLFDETAALRGSREEITRMPMAVNLNHFKPGSDGIEVRAKYGWEKKFVLGYIGTLTGWHGIKLLYDLAPRLRNLGARDFVIMLVGGDEKRLASNRLKVAEAGLDGIICFLGAVPYQDVPKYIRAMDVALVPDTTIWSSPAKLFEYQGCAVPVLAPRYPAIERAMTQGIEGYLFEPRDVADMARKAKEFYDDPAKRLAMGAKGRERAVTFHSWEAQARSIISIYESQGKNLAPAHAKT